MRSPLHCFRSGCQHVAYAIHTVNKELAEDFFIVFIAFQNRDGLVNDVFSENNNTSRVERILLNEKQIKLSYANAVCTLGVRFPFGIIFLLL